jgi:enamine deaminase RidA (YjgF/YER057c/UK114 family)
VIKKLIMSSKRPARETIRQDIISMNGLNNVSGYYTSRPEATQAGLQSAYETMLEQQKIEVAQQALTKQATEAACKAEQDFHEAVLAMKDAVKGQFGSDSKETTAIGLTRKSDRKPPTRKPKEPAVAL